MKLKNFTFLLPRGAVILALLLCSMNLRAQTYSLSTLPNLTGATTTTSPNGMTFNLKALKAPLKITNFTIDFSGTSGTWEVWYKTDSINGVPVISTTNNWILHETGSWSGGTGVVNLGMKSPIKIPQGKTYGIYVKNASGSARYHSNTTGGKSTWSDGNLQLYAGTGVAYVVYATGNIANRQYKGEVTYAFDYSSPNDAGISELTKPQSFCAGTQDVEVQVQNFGSKQLDSVRVNWSLDGVLQKPVSFTTKLDTFTGKGSTTGLLKLTSLTFSASTKHTIKVWTSHPNGVKDTVNLNDTLTASLAPALSGTFTINPAGSGTSNFRTFSAAINALTTQGICGPVVFNVAAGTYTERVVVPEIAGTSATNTITFDGGDKTRTTITNNGTSTANWQTVLLDGADRVTFRNFTINGTSSTFAVGIFLTNSADNNTFRNVDVNVSTTTTTTNVEGVVGSASATSYSTAGNPGENNTFDSMNIAGGYYGVYYTGVSTSSTIQGSVFNRLYLNGQYYYGINVQYLENPVITNCVVERPVSTSSYGMRVYYCLGPVVMNNNIRGGSYGIYFYYNNVNGYKNVRGKVINNMIAADNTYGIYGYGSDYIDYYHNTLVANGTGALTASFGNELNIRNNIFVNYSSTSTNEALSLASSSIIGNNLDNNIYYTPNGAGVVDNGTVYPTLAAWQSAQTNHDQNSLYMQPDFVSATDLHLNPNNGQPFGRYVGVDTDIDRQTRCQMAPTIGADESTVGKTTRPTANFSVSDTLFVNSPATFFNGTSANDPYFYQWYVDGIMVEDSVHLNVTPPSTGTFTVKMVITGCAGKDSITRTIRVINPVSRPSVRFLSDKSIIVQGETVRFTDISRNGATAWKWEISPDSTFDGADKIARYKYLHKTDASSQHPIVQFISAGRYKVCLTASNSLGANTLCRTDYIIVESGYSLQAGKQTILDSSAYLFDNGGRNASYTNNFSGSFLLAPCAEEVYLVFRKFDLECGYDYVRVYDGTDNTGKPLHCTGNMVGVNGPGFTGGSFTCATSANTCIPTMTDTFVAKSGRMFIEMSSNASNAGAGFEAYYWAKPKAQPKPMASFEVPDSVCINQALNFKNTSTGDDMSFYWDLDNDISTFEMVTKDAIWPYYMTGTVSVTLLAQNCGGTDTFTKDIVVYAPATPNISFLADNTNPTINDVVFMSSTIKECVDDYRWRFTSATGKSSVTYVNGTTFRSARPQVVFSEKGCYSVQLYAANTAGADSLRLTCYINVKDAYCTPTVANNVSDLGISKVTINTLSSTSSQGVDDYQNFVSTRSTTLELGVTYNLTVERTTAQNEISRAAWIDWNADGDFNDAGEKVAEQLNSSSRNWTASIQVPTTAKTGATIMRVASNDGSFGNRVCGQNEYGEYEDYRIYVAPYLTLPVITLTGSDTLYLEQGVVYTEPGYTATSRLYGNISSDVVVTAPVSGFYTIPGVYTFTYNVEDAAGNNAVAVTRTVIVSRDTTAPELVIAGSDTIEVQVGSSFSVPAIVRADDLVDGDVRGAVITSNGVNANVVGSYTVVYTVTDRSGNMASVTRYVNVIDTVMPTMVLVGSDPAIHEVATAYNDSGVTVKDNYYTEAQLRANLTVQSNVNENVLGTYTVVYTLSDPFTGEAVTLTRSVEVRDRTAPVVTLVGDTAIILDVNTALSDPGVNITDNFDGNPTVTKGGSFYTAFPNGVATTLGRYIVEYTVRDASGNVTVIRRTVNVVDRIAPVITLKGEPTVNVCRWSPYTDAGYDVSDNFSQNSKIIVTEEGNFTTEGTSLIGIYNLRYKAVDESGNVAYSEYRRISVRNPYEFPCETNVGVGKDVSLERSVNVYPNPNTGKFTVEANLPQNEQVRISVTNLLGQEVAVISNGAMNTTKFQVDLSNQKAGVYMLNIRTADQNITKRIVITK